MGLDRDILPITELKRDDSEIVRTADDERRRVIVTQNGRPKAVLMGIREYEAMRDGISLLRMALMGERDFRAGRVMSQQEAFDAFDAAMDLHEE